MTSFQTIGSLTAFFRQRLLAATAGTVTAAGLVCGVAAVLCVEIDGPVLRAQESPAETQVKVEPAENEKTVPSISKAADRPIHALLVTGGCCHDYERQKLILARGISARANVRWTIAHQGGSATNSKIPLYEDPNWSDGFDIVVHNECFADVSDQDFVERIVKPHREGLPAILIHCAMHCYRTGTDKWFEFAGMQSPGHGPHYAFRVDNKLPTHTIMEGFGRDWTVPKGELYHSVKLWPTATVLATADRQSDNQPQTCVWTNQYGKGRVFCTTIGHYNETMAQPVYLDMVTRGLLWAVGRDVNAEFIGAAEETNKAIMELVSADIDAKQTNELPVNCCGVDNLAYQKEAAASSEETSKDNYAKNAVDGNLSTRWCADGAGRREFWQVDLGTVQPVKSLRIHWESGNAAYRYKIESSKDGQDWKNIVDQSKNDKPNQIAAHTIEIVEARYLKVKFLGSSTGSWGSFWEFEAYSGELPDLPAGVVSGDAAKKPSIADIQAPEGFEVRLFGAPPEVNYPVCITAAATGEVFVGVDEQGSLGKTPGGGRVLRCIDTDGDGKADKINVFAEMEHPRGLVYDSGSLWVLHPPTLTVFHDSDGDGVADQSQVLLTGISTDEVNKRGADHTTNGIRMGIDGWIYIAVGDFGFQKAVGTDGRTLSRRGGGVVRVRPDGTDMEIYSWGQRNIVDIGIDPFLALFTRDNTNDGDGWDIRVSHVMQSANYGYPSLYKNFTEEIMPPIGDYGGGSGCGVTYFQDSRWPEPYNNAFYSCDWGRSEIYRHNHIANGATFDPHQEKFLTVERPTDIDADGSGRMYVASWKNGGFSYSDPNVGYVAQLVPKDFTPKPFPNLSQLSNLELVELLDFPSDVGRLQIQRDILRRGKANAGDASAIGSDLVNLAANQSKSLEARVAALFTLKQLLGSAANPFLAELASVDDIREFALRALTDRLGEINNVPTDLFIEALRDKNARVRAQAVISLGRLGDESAAKDLLPLTMRSAESSMPTQSPTWNQADPGRVIPHLAVKSLISLQAVKACLDGVNKPYRHGALLALQEMHSIAAVDGLFQVLGLTRDPEIRLEIMTALMRLHYREGEFEKGWWGTRPDTKGPYFDKQTWSESPRIAAAIKAAIIDADPATAVRLKREMDRHQIQIDGITDDSTAGEMAVEEQPIVVPPVDPNNPNQIANIVFNDIVKRAVAASGDAKQGESLFRSQSCIACHTYANGQTPKGPHLVDIGKRYNRSELITSILKPSDKIAQGFDTEAFLTLDGKIIEGFVVSESAETVTLRQSNGVSMQLKADDIDQRLKRTQSMMPDGLVNNITPEQLADLIAYLESLH